MRSNLSAPSHEGIFYRAEQATDLTTRERQYFFLAIADARTQHRHRWRLPGLDR
jgi:hypothetical protein